MTAMGTMDTTACVGKLEVPVPMGCKPNRTVLADLGMVKLILYRSPAKSVFDAPSPAVLAIKVPATVKVADYGAWGAKLVKDISGDKMAKHVLAEKIRESLAMTVTVGTSKEDVKRVGKAAAGTIVRKSSAPKTVGVLKGVEERWLVGGVYHVQAFAAVHDGILYVIKVHALEPYFSKDAVPKYLQILAKAKVHKDWCNDEDKTAFAALPDDKWAIAAREVLTA